ncbi:uncharacterized protein LOC114742100 isoform X2 [Neltuma alba]|uniref:uncharacterized protein LOC114742100 isoform X2 n=1 Tax=Neltuma alba TaxID=207710 RepID=UPI0010A4C67C|nr:uncharacterized protein LOC114742100 isoform X2 [Prosopis alba]
MEWQDCTVKMEVNVPASAAYNFYSDREAIPRWMPFISSVTVLPDKPDLSRWSLKYKAFGRDIEYSWLARNMQPIPNQKIHWRSLEGLPNRIRDTGHTRLGRKFQLRKSLYLDIEVSCDKHGGFCLDWKSGALFDFIQKVLHHV